MSSAAPKITVHHLQHSRSERIIWLLEEVGFSFPIWARSLDLKVPPPPDVRTWFQLELQYEINVVERDPKTLLAPKEARDIHPLGKVNSLAELRTSRIVHHTDCLRCGDQFPVVTIEENGETTVLAESGGSFDSFCSASQSLD